LTLYLTFLIFRQLEDRKVVVLDAPKALETISVRKILVKHAGIFMTNSCAAVGLLVRAAVQAKLRLLMKLIQDYALMNRLVEYGALNAGKLGIFANRGG